MAKGRASIRRGRIRSLATRGTASDKSPPVARKAGRVHEPMGCERCGAIYLHKIWRRSNLARTIPMGGIRWTICPSCKQVGRGVGFGRVLVRGTLSPTLEVEIRRRINNVTARARWTQPERQIVSLVRKGSAIEVVTTSQKLAHRIARELQKAFGGRTSYSWADRDGELLATCDLAAEK